MPDRLSAEQLDAIQRELRAGRKLAAVKIYVEATGDSLMDAKRFVESLPVAPESTEPRPSDRPGSLSDDRMDEILDAVHAGKKLEAVKLYKEATGSSLAASKDAIENLMRQLESAQPGSVAHEKGCLATMLILITLLGGVFACIT